MSAIIHSLQDQGIESCGIEHQGIGIQLQDIGGFCFPEAAPVFGQQSPQTGATPQVAAPLPVGRAVLNLRMVLQVLLHGRRYGAPGIVENGDWRCGPRPASCGYGIGQCVGIARISNDMNME